MYRHVLIATDGSELAGKAVTHGIELARTLNAKATAITVTAPWDAAIGKVVVATPEQDYEHMVTLRAQETLAGVARLAEAAGVPCELIHKRAPVVYAAVIGTAEALGCDVIVVASHGRRGLEGLIVGSETQRILSHSKIPVLVYR